MTKKLFKLAILFCFLAPSLTSQTTPVAPPPPAPEGPSLVETMQFIQDKISAIGKLKYLIIENGDTESVDEEITSVKGDPPKCTLHFRKNLHINRKGGSENITIAFGDVQKVIVRPFPYDAESNATHHTSPTISDLVLADSYGVVINHWYVAFEDPDMADRVAKAATHAIELCQASSNSKNKTSNDSHEPF